MRNYITTSKLARLADTTPDRVARHVKAGKLTADARLYTGAPLFDLDRVEECRTALQQEGK